jgi:outer membrane protein assembly factor BamA
VPIFLALWAALTTGLGITDAPPGPSTPAPPPPRREYVVVPLVGGDTDYGIGAGYLANVAGLRPDVEPFAWRVESAGFITFKAAGNGGVASSEGWRNPYQDYYVLLQIPRFLHRRLRLDLRPSFTRETTQHYYGLGNASVAPPDEIASRDFYGRMHPTLLLRLRWELRGNVFVEYGSSYTENWLDVDPQSRLAADMASGPPDVRELLGTATQHGVLLTETSFGYDSRDSEISPDRGQYHQLRFRGSPRLGAHLPYEYAQVNLTNRFYATVVPARLVFAARVVVDVQFGDVPFYELPRYEDTFALGGVNGVRGIPGQRYYGRLKVFSNLELRSHVAGFTIAGKPYALGAALFTDFGRLWSDVASNPDLDGAGWGLKYGVGGGVRVQKGQTFVIRVDLAWSPDARPLGAYLTAGQAF